MNTVVEELQSLVERNRVCYEVWPEHLRVRDKNIAVGFQLELLGMAPHEDGHPEPKWTELCHTFADLERIAEWILPKEHRASFYEIEPYRSVIRATRKRKLREEVSLSIKILHRDHYEDPIDKCETRCLMEMTDRLKQIGACEGEWKPNQATE